MQMHRACVAGRLDAELLAVSKRVSKVLQRLPRDITPVNLEELRRVKQTLVELESKADTLRCASATLLTAAPAVWQATRKTESLQIQGESLPLDLHALLGACNGAASH